MKVDVRDDEIFDALTPVALEQYLRNSRWTEQKHIPGEVSIWSYDSGDGQKHRVWLPLDRGLSDYAQSVNRLVRVLADVENRSQLQLIEDLETVAIGDVIRFKSFDRLNKFSSSLSLNDGLSFVQQVQEMTSAAATSVIEKREILSRRRPNKAIEYMNSVRLGQTERGSFLVKLISPLSPVEYTQLHFPDIPTEDEPPFERQVVVNLMSSLSSLQAVASEALTKGRFYFEAFQELVPRGVSANLCEAVTNMTDGRAQFRPLEVSVTWSYAIAPPEQPLTQHIEFPTEIMPYISRAAELFREMNPESVILRGYVTGLRRGKDEPVGHVTIVTLLGSRQRGIRVDMTSEAYNIAIQAHEEDLEVSCEGSLEKQGNLFVLRDPTNFHIVR